MTIESSLIFYHMYCTGICRHERRKKSESEISLTQPCFYQNQILVSTFLLALTKLRQAERCSGTALSHWQKYQFVSIEDVVAHLIFYYRRSAIQHRIANAYE